MTYKTVMVGLALGQPNDARLEVAAQLAKWFGARVIGVAGAEFSPPLYFTEGEPAQRLIDQGWAAVKNRLKELEGGFRAAMQNRAVEVEWRCGEDFPTRFIVRQARASDIIVVGEAARGGLADPFVQVNPSDLVMQVGRPLLVVPESCSWLDLRSVLVAWKDTTEARRAVNDALPLLHKSTEIYNCRNCRGRGRPRRGAVAGRGCRGVVVAAWRTGIAAGARAMWRCRRAIGASGIGRRRRRGYCRRLWPLKAERVDPRGRDAAAHQSSDPLLLAVTLNLILINAAG